MAGRVRVGPGDRGRSAMKPGDLVPADVPVALEAGLPFVSRGGEKLAAALDAFAIDSAGLVCLDAGASTGGFTDCLLQRGAARVHAVDVGRGQLAAALAVDGRVIVHDRVNARFLSPQLLGETVALAVADLSFISLALVLESIASCVRPGGLIVPLVKPQFEAGRGHAPRGVVRDPAVHRAVLERVVSVARGLGLEPRDVIASPLRGPAGNREFFVLLRVGEETAGGPRTGGAAGPDLGARIAAVTG
jgi:23S rRNA (cytidine1920-2'-O)/16S rRNA (cytidine1409-2'-O)-methyltransferase